MPQEGRAASEDQAQGHNRTCHYYKGQEHPRGALSTKGTIKNRQGNFSLRCHLSLRTKTGSGTRRGYRPCSAALSVNANISSSVVASQRLVCRGDRRAAFVVN